MPWRGSEVPQRGAEVSRRGAEVSRKPGCRLKSAKGETCACLHSQPQPGSLRFSRDLKQQQQQQQQIARPPAPSLSTPLSTQASERPSGCCSCWAADKDEARHPS